LIAVPQGSSVSTASLKRNYQFAGFDYTSANIGLVRNYEFPAAPDGNGNLGSLSITGAAENLTTPETVQAITGATYSVASNVLTMSFPLPSGGTATGEYITGSKQFG
jgi:hypothetical protein